MPLRGAESSAPFALCPSRTGRLPSGPAGARIHRRPSVDETSSASIVLPRRATRSRPRPRRTWHGTWHGTGWRHVSLQPSLSASPAGGIAFAARGEWGGAVPALPAPPSPVGPFGEVRDPEEAEVLRRAKGRECSQIQLGEMGCRWLQTGGWCIISLVRPGVHLSLVGEGREPGGVSAMTLQTVAPPGPRAAY